MRGKMAFVGFGVCFTSLNKEQPPVQINSGFNNHSEFGFRRAGGDSLELEICPSL